MNATALTMEEYKERIADKGSVEAELDTLLVKAIKAEFVKRITTAITKMAVAENSVDAIGVLKRTSSLMEGMTDGLLAVLEQRGDAN